MIRATHEEGSLYLLRAELTEPPPQPAGSLSGRRDGRRWGCSGEEEGGHQGIVECRIPPGMTINRPFCPATEKKLAGVSSQLQQGFSIRIAAVSRDSPEKSLPVYGERKYVSDGSAWQPRHTAAGVFEGRF